jgi:hypothetical protein
MTTQKSTIGRSILFDSVRFQVVECNESNVRTSMDDLMAILMRRHRARVCLRAQEGVTESQAAHCECIFCSPDRQRVRFGATFEEMGAKFAEEEAPAAVRTKAHEKTRYVHRLLASAGARHNRLKSVAIRGL